MPAHVLGVGVHLEIEAGRKLGDLAAHTADGSVVRRGHHLNRVLAPRRSGKEVAHLQTGCGVKCFLYL